MKDMRGSASEAPFHWRPAPGRQSWSARLNERFETLAAERAHALAARLRERAVDDGVWSEVDGRREPLAVALRPRLMDLASRGYVHHVMWQIRAGLRRVVRLVAMDAWAAAVLPLEPGEAQWQERYRRLDARYGSPRGERIFCRLDTLGRLEGPGWREQLRVLEVNVVGVGGMSYAPPAEALMMEESLPLLTRPEDDFDFDVNDDPRELLLDELLHHARAIGAQDRPVIALVDDRSLYTLGGEMGRLAAYIAGRGFEAVYVDPRELEVSHAGRVVARGRPIDVLYRFLEVRDLVALEARGDAIPGLRAAFEQGIVVPSIGGDLEHKSVFELLTDPDFAAVFDPETRQVIADHVLWTRLLRERRTSVPDGRSVDLVPWVERNRERLVIKPNRGAGGEGVVIGQVVGASAWRAVLDTALGEPDVWVVQEAAPIDEEPFPVIEPDGRLAITPTCFASGFFPGRIGLGVFGRYAHSPVVNIQAGGGIAPMIVSVR